MDQTNDEREVTTVETAREKLKLSEQTKPGKIKTTLHLLLDGYLLTERDLFVKFFDS